MMLIMGITAAARMYWMLSANYNAMMILFLFFTVLPFVFLVREGRVKIGLVKPHLWWHLPLAFCCGTALAYCVHIIGVVLYGSSSLHWFMAVKSTVSGRSDLFTAVQHTPILFIVIALPSMIFSPLGEEFFFRGVLHTSLEERFGTISAVIIDAAAFALTHVAHYGILSTADGIVVLFPSILVWILLMAFTALVFAAVKYFTASLWAAVLCHAGFNGMMMWCICFLL
jgi:hypothetical protein